MIRIDLDLCIGCGQCLSACDFSAITLLDNLARVNENCTSCGMCVSTCPVKAISVDIEQTASEGHRGILVMAQVQNGSVMDVSLALCQKAYELNRKSGAPVYAVLLGPYRDQAQQLIQHGADTVLCCEDERLADEDDGLYTDTLTMLIHAYKPAIVLFGATSFGRSLAPRMAVRLHTGLTADCTELSIDEESGLLHQTRPAFGGNLMATIVCPNARPQMASVRPGVFSLEESKATRKDQILSFEMPSGAQPLYTILSKAQNPAVQSIADADIIVTAGRGIGNQKNMQLVRDFAQKIGAQVAVTRPLADAGWGEIHQQIGQTGHTVSPKLLIALGVSGAIQHLAGMGGAQTVIAVNTDSDAPIFSVADYAIHADCVALLQQLLT